ncbi:MAG TPA: AI-2E family transporter [Deltaproteobacteria bacterium]|nr:AI-2E family transporter [Deltaproteobacteria bacterium]
MSDDLLPESPWSKETQDRWFYGYLAASLIAMVMLALPFADVLLFAATTVVVTWPVFETVEARCGGRRAVAAGITTVLLLVLVLVPLSLLTLWFVQQSLHVVQQAVEYVTGGQLEAYVSQLVGSLEQLGSDEDWWTPWLEDLDLVGMVTHPLRDGLVALAQSLTTAVPWLVGSVVVTAVDVVIYLFAVVTLYMEGPRVARAAMHLSPMDDRYEKRLFLVFREFSNNLVIGSLATAAVQGLVASIGFTVAGVDQLLFVSILTAAMSFFPIFGTAMVWGPVSLYVGATKGLGWGVFLAVWNAGLTGGIDNLVRPLFLRGSSDIHPLLIFLAVLGGLSWMGFPGALVGPVIVAAFLALFTIYREDFLGIGPDGDALPGDALPGVHPPIPIDAGQGPAAAAVEASEAPPVEAPGSPPEAAIDAARAPAVAEAEAPGSPPGADDPDPRGSRASIEG